LLVRGGEGMVHLLYSLPLLKIYTNLLITEKIDRTSA
jgi:hypothetical protein